MEAQVVLEGRMWVMGVPWDKVLGANAKATADLFERYRAAVKKEYTTHKEKSNTPTKSENS